MSAFGRHVPASERPRGGQSAMAVFTRGLQIGGTQWKFKFANGYGASVINDGYGGDNGLYELGILDPTDHLTYSTGLTDDVVGWLTGEQVADYLDQIEALTPESIAAAAEEKAHREREERIAELREELARLEAEVTK